MKIAWFDCFSGISGDMCLGALVDAGVPLKEIEKGLKALQLKGYRLTEKKVLRAGLSATKVDVVLSSESGKSEARRWKDIRKTVKDSSLPGHIKEQGLRIFRSLFDAEAKVHGTTIGKTHLHELGCVDCLVDIFGVLLGLSYLGVEKVYASAINTGSGTVKTEHGVLPVPAPATAELLKGIPCYSYGPGFEMTTPTGAALIKTLSSGFGERPYFSADKIGLGAGGKDPECQPNLLRLMVGEGHKNMQNESVTVIETNIDDMNPQIYEYVMERLFSAGALDVFLTPVIMKKSRPGVLLSVLCSDDKRNSLIQIILEETTSIGIRFHEAGRVTMERKMNEVKTEYGRIKVKASSFGSASKSTPEYEDCKKIAKEKNIPLIKVIEAAKRGLISRKK